MKQKKNKTRQCKAHYQAFDFIRSKGTKPAEQAPGWFILKECIKY